MSYKGKSLSHTALSLTKVIIVTAYSLHFDSAQEGYKSTVNTTIHFNSLKGSLP